MTSDQRALEFESGQPGEENNRLDIMIVPLYGKTVRKPLIEFSFRVVPVSAPKDAKAPADLTFQLDAGEARDFALNVLEATFASAADATIVQFGEKLDFPEGAVVAMLESFRDVRIREGLQAEAEEEGEAKT